MRKSTVLATQAVGAGREPGRAGDRWRAARSWVQFCVFDNHGGFGSVNGYKTVRAAPDPS